MQSENMLRSGSGSSNLCQSNSTNNSTVSAQASGSASAPTTNSIKDIKGESYPPLSPCNESKGGQKKMEDHSTHNQHHNNSCASSSSNSSSNNNMVIDTAQDSTTPVSSILRRNSNSNSVNSAIANASPPNAGSDHSNSSNLSATLDNHVTMMQELNTEKSSKPQRHIKEENGGEKPIMENNSNEPAKNMKSNSSPLNALATVKDESDSLSNLMHIKKEETVLSPPNMSPVGFGALGSVNCDGKISRSATPAKISTISPDVEGSCKNKEKLGCMEENVGAGFNINTSNDECNNLGGPAQQRGVLNHFGGNGGNGGNGSSSSLSGPPVGNCLDYMQQQNHIFVFSTQLANKGAESVLNGHFPTIIAYHCTQPATKSFLEDFFSKNPLKMTKLQRQNAINMCGGVPGGIQPWMNTCNTLNKQQQSKGMGNKMGLNSIPSNVDSKGPVSISRSANMTGFVEGNDSLPNDTDIMCWEPSRNTLDDTTPEGALKILDRIEANSQHSALKVSAAVGSATSALEGLSDCNIPSLQGVKVPDENLTPQQRQHREEQLAKLKKMNQFLFPESGSDPNNPLQAKLESVPGNIGSGLLINLPGIGGSPMVNAMNPNVRNMTLLNHPKGPSSICNTENAGPGIGEEAAVSSDISSQDSVGLTCNTNKSGRGSNMSMSSPQCGGMPGNVNASAMSINELPCHIGGRGGSNGLMPNSPELMGGFNPQLGTGGGVNKSLGLALTNDMNQPGMSPMEWSKLQNHFFEERVKSNKSGGPDISCHPASICRSNSTGMGGNMRGNLMGVSAPGVSNQNMRSSQQGPPPPYHPTQRSASVPIATQSPNPASPNNPSTSNLSLPSPCTPVALGIPTSSPNLEAHGVGMSTTTTTMTTQETSVTTAPHMQASKNNLPPDVSPTHNNNNNSRTRNNNNSYIQYNSNPSTPLPHLSPKDLESYNQNLTQGAGELKNARPSPQRSRTPGINSNVGSSDGNPDVRFPAISPGLNFPGSVGSVSSGSGGNAYKGPGGVERQNSASILPAHNRRADNVPLNPNSSRSQTKLNHSFDPISSLAQMSQQLTSCVPVNANIVGSPGGMGGAGNLIGPGDVNMSTGGVNSGMEGMINQLGSGMEHCSPSGMGMPPHMNGPPVGQSSAGFGLNPMMGGRLMNPKMCGSGSGPGMGFNPSNDGIQREMGASGNSGNFHGVLPPHRMMTRMPMNFGNFNVSPNIQVKASTPNTIQYMPVRPQNTSGSNIRVPPSLEFLQRYANPSQHMGGPGSTGSNLMMEGTVHDLNKPQNHITANGNINNNQNTMGVVGGTNSPIHFFQNCNQMGGPIGMEPPDDMSGGIMSGQHDMSGRGAHMGRGGIRAPIRQHNMQSHTGPRMQAPNGGQGMQFPCAQTDNIECTDTDGGASGVASVMFPGNSSGNGPPMQGQLYTGVSSGQPKVMKGMGNSGICSNMNTVNSGNNGGQMGNLGVMLQNEQNSLNGSSGMMVPASGNMPMPNPMSMSGSNLANIGCGNVGVGNGNFKSFVGPTSNDLKYAQQYHSFQQQLYATSTRSQQGGGSLAGNMGPNMTSNFFVNK